MSLFKCKICGGALEINEGESVAVCQYCGVKQTLPKLDNDRKANLYDRANHFRRNNDFDKAMSIYEQILNEDTTDAESYWSIILCRYGIEYVEDPATRKRLPTVNRAQYTSVFDDEDYKSALQYADEYQRDIYESEATAINEIQKGILDIASKEDPFDVFICYKETDNNGRRTPDSVLATELYHELTKEGFKVFFSRITLEDKLGEEYEPYIFAALNSAKAMVVLGTKPDYFNAVWVKNEWSRFLSLIKSGARKTLIPAYRDMDPYDLPEEFSHLQAQDMSKLGFMQDLIHGIKKIVGTNEQESGKEKMIVNAGSVNIAPLLKRAFMFLEDGEWDSADEYCEKILDRDPECAEAYLGKMMAELHVSKKDQLADCAEPFDDNKNYIKALRFADDVFAFKLKSFNSEIRERVKDARLSELYNDAVNAMLNANSEAAYQAAAESFREIASFRDAETRMEECLEKAENVRKDAIYASAKIKMSAGKIAEYEAAIKAFETISGWRDADEQIYSCQKEIEKLKAKAEADRLERERLEQIRIAREKRERKLQKIVKLVATLSVVFLFASLFLINQVILPTAKYNKAVALYNAGKYSEAITAFEALDGYKDSSTYASNAFYQMQKSGLTIVSVGSTIKFGAYEQDNNTNNGKEEIEWQVLAKEGTKILVISKYALDCKQYHTSYTDVTWETCSLRGWLNGTFYDDAFGTTEKARIVKTTVSADKNPRYSTNAGSATSDNVFLLSITEVNKYFSSDEARKCVPTAYAKAQGAYTSSTYTVGGKATCWWWLRSPGSDQNYAASVGRGGSVIDYAYHVDRDNVAVRPALWIDLNS